MPKQAQPEGIVINRFWAGLNTQRNPLTTPISFVGLRVIERPDALLDGVNVEVSNSHTLVRRPGFPRYCPTAFGTNEYPLNYFSWHKNDGSVSTFVDTQNAVYSFTASGRTAIYAKTTTQETQFQNVGNTLFFCDGTALRKYANGQVKSVGLTAPTTAPTIAFTSGTLNITSGVAYTYAFKDSTTGHVSSAAPVSANTGKQTLKQFTVSGSGTGQTGIDTIVIFRTLDRGANYYYLAEFANPGAGQTWQYADTATDDKLNNFITAPVDALNDPPPAGISNVILYQGRLWGAVGNLLYFSAGGDTTIGVPEECWPKANVLTFPGQITALQYSGAGLLVFTADTVSMVLGGPQTLTYYNQTMWTNFGVLSQNAISADTDTLYIYTTQGQLMSLAASNKDDVGSFVGDILKANFNPSKTYVAVHRNGTDAYVFLSSTTGKMLAYSLSTQSWSTLSGVAGGVGAIASIETTVGDYTLLAGRSSGSGYILGRDLSTFQDDGQNYPAHFVMGSLTLAQPGTQPMTVSHLVIDRTPVGSEIGVSVLMNDITGTFTSIPWGGVSDPHMLPPSTGVVSNRYDLLNAQTPLPQLAKSMMLRIDFATENAKNEILSLAVQPQQA